jgi:hypothetical protein
MPGPISLSRKEQEAIINIFSFLLLLFRVKCGVPGIPAGYMPELHL